MKLSMRERRRIIRSDRLKLARGLDRKLKGSGSGGSKGCPKLVREDRGMGRRPMMAYLSLDSRSSAASSMSRAVACVRRCVSYPSATHGEISKVGDSVAIKRVGFAADIMRECGDGSGDSANVGRESDVKCGA
jgi:hypothetical protein